MRKETNPPGPFGTPGFLRGVWPARVARPRETHSTPSADPQAILRGRTLQDTQDGRDRRTRITTRTVEHVQVQAKRSLHSILTQSDNRRADAAHTHRRRARRAKRSRTMADETIHAMIRVQKSTLHHREVPHRRLRRPGSQASAPCTTSSLHLPPGGEYRRSGHARAASAQQRAPPSCPNRRTATSPCVQAPPDSPVHPSPPSGHAPRMRQCRVCILCPVWRRSALDTDGSVWLS